MDVSGNALQYWLLGCTVYDGRKNKGQNKYNSEAYDQDRLPYLVSKSMVYEDGYYMNENMSYKSSSNNLNSFNCTFPS